MDIALKQRLVGASVLIALAVVVLPMLFGGRPDDGAGESPAIEIPEQPPELDFETRRYPIGQDGQARPADDAQPHPPLNLPAPDPQAQAMESAPGQATHVELDPAPKVDLAVDEEDTPPPGTEPVEGGEEEQPVAVVTPVPPPSAVASGRGRYIVQVASFGSVNNANRLSGQLRELGYAVQDDTVSSEVGTLNRVRVGPYASEADAERAVAALQQKLPDVKPRVIDTQPEQAAPVTRPSDPLVRWVVQVGSFASASNADNLVARLRLEGMNAYKEGVRSSGATVYRVRVGPFIERDEAIRKDRLINERLQLDGVVMSAD